MAFDAIVLAGGTATRLGGNDKALVEINGTSLLERSLRAVARAQTTIVVGPERPTGRSVVWTREQPPGSGPAAGIAAGIRHARTDLVVVLAVDLPLVTDVHVDRLIAAIGQHDGACFVDPNGRDQPLAAVYRRTSIERAIAMEPQRDRSVRSLVGDLDLARIRDRAAALDCDTPDDIRKARELEGERVR